MVMRRNVLIFHLGALGDFVLTWPLALALSRIYPQSRIIYVTHGEKAQLAEKVLRVESSDVENGWHGLFAESGALPARAETLLAGAHAIYNFLSPSAVWNANVNRFNSYAKVVSLEAKPPADFAGHASQWLLNQLKAQPIDHAAVEQILRSVADRGVGFARNSTSGIVMHPGSGSPAKCWAVENFVALANRLKAKGKSVRFVIGEVEREQWPAEDLKKLEAVGLVRHPGNYLELLAELSGAEMFIGNDSGPGHLAGIIGVPTVSIFMGTNLTQWKPLGPRVTVVDNPSVDDVVKCLDSVAEATK